MNKEIKDGLNIKSFFVIDERKPGFPISARAIQVLAIMIGSWAFISVLIESLNIPVNVFEVNAVILICTGIFTALYLFPSYDLVKLFFCVLFYGLYFYSRLPRLINGFYLLENLIIDRITAYYNYNYLYYVADELRITEDTTLLVSMLLIPIMALLAAAVIRNRFTTLCSILLFLPITASFMLGLIPSEKYLVAYIAAVLYLSRSGASCRNMTSREQKTLMHRINSRAGVWMSIMGILIFFLLKLFVTEKEYKNIPEIKDMKNDVQTAMLDFSVQDFTDKFKNITLFDSGNMTVGGLSGGRLGKTGSVEFSNSQQLILTLPISSLYEGLYLKGYVGSEYTGSSWEEHTKEERSLYRKLLEKLPKKNFVPVNQTYQLLDHLFNTDDILTGIDATSAFMQEAPGYQINKGNMEIEYKDANRKFIYAPYFTDYEALPQTHYAQDLYSAPTVKSSKYEFNYFFHLQQGLQSFSLFSNLNERLGDYTKYEKLYRDYVYKVYTKLPNKGLERLKKDFSQEKMSSIATGIAEKIDYVKTYLESNTSYTLSPGKLPKDKDFVEYFLYENKKGYCAHYASAAVLMLRAMGVPARYVEGYAIGPGRDLGGTGEYQTMTSYTENGVLQYDEPMANLFVMDYNAHAWVEVYIDGCGWIPMEFTPGSVMPDDTSMINSLSQADNFMNKDKDKEVEPTKEPQEPTTAPQDQEINKRTAQKDRQPSPAPNTTKQEKTKLDIVFPILFFLLSATAVTLFVVFRIGRRNQLINTADHNKKAIYLYREIEKMLSFGHALPGKRACLEDCEEYVQEHPKYINSKLFSVVMDTVKKARFGKNSISLNELRAVEALHRQLLENMNGDLPVHKRMVMKILLFM